MRTLILLLILLIPTQAKALTLRQMQVMAAAEIQSDQMGHPYLLTAIVLAESSAGENMVGDDGTSIGVPQLKVGTAIEMLKRNAGVTSVSRKAIRKRILTDDGFALLIARWYLEYLIERFGTIEAAIMAYNIGPTAYAEGRKLEQGRRYLQRVEGYMEWLEREGA